MNWIHRWLCRSESWRKTLRQRVPWVLANAHLGPDVLELGPGPGLTTELLRASVSQLTAIEIDPKSAESLRSRLANSNVRVITGDATAMPFPDCRFSAAVSFTMLHHVPTPQLQDKLLREVSRVLQPGGIFAGVDSLQSWRMRIIHTGDTLVLIDPSTFGERLHSAGLQILELEKGANAFRFLAQKPG